MDSAFWQGKRVFLTGHTGFKGSWLSLWLQVLGAEVSGYALAPATAPALFDLAHVGKGMVSTLGDIRDLPRLTRALQQARPEIVLHLAAQALVGASYADPLETFSTNVLGTAGLLEACRAQPGVRAVVSVTSDKCYENQGWERGYVETDPMGGFDPYSASKGCAELIGASYRRSFFEKAGIGLASARAGNVFGGGDFTEGRLVPDCLRAMSEERPVRLRYPDSVRPWQHVLEPLSGYLQLAQRLFQAPEAFSEGWNFGPDLADARPVKELVELCQQAWGSQLPWEQEPGNHPHEAVLLRLDSSKAQTRLGWQPAWKLAEAVRHTIVWHQAFGAGQDLAALMRLQIEAHGAVHA